MGVSAQAAGMLTLLSPSPPQHILVTFVDLASPVIDRIAGTSIQVDVQ
jgi:hypothetical protein